MESVDILPPEKIAFIAYNIGVYESVQKFGRLITSGKITNGTDVSRVAELLAESLAFYDAEMVSELMNTMLRHTNNNAINKVTAGEVSNIMNQLKAVGVSIP
jgi:L-aminopeptidase/D-esterase-like protein